MKNDDSTADLISLIDAACFDALDAAQASRLEGLLAEDREARCLYIQRMALHAGLHCRIAHFAESKSLLPGELEDFPVSSTQDVDSEKELSVSTENILSMLEGDAEVEQRKAEERARI
ncbi:MAG: hypothetical protein GXP26_06070, partial [Planctomycetes bacterium]|nr:hypothetical protein [Planctomycetota bacterium]